MNTNKFENSVTKFGYPLYCDECNKTLVKCNFEVGPYYKENNSNKKLMIIGQDPTIREKGERVKSVLMLKEENGQLSRFLKEVFGDFLDKVSLYATNIVKCKLDPTKLFARKTGGFKFLAPYFEYCKEHLKTEILTFKPNYIVTLGEPAHKLTIKLFDNTSMFKSKMTEDFTGSFYKVSLNGFDFEYSPLLHIQTFRIANKYGQKVIDFKNTISKIK